MPEKSQNGPKTPETYRRLERSEHPHSKKRTPAGTVDGNDPVTVTLIVRRGPGARPLSIEDFTRTARSRRRRISREEFAETHGAAREGMESVAEFARAQGLAVLEANQARRSVVVRGTAHRSTRPSRWNSVITICPAADTAVLKAPLTFRPRSPKWWKRLSDWITAPFQPSAGLRGATPTTPREPNRLRPNR
jgi:hypothetical protein